MSNHRGPCPHLADFHQDSSSAGFQVACVRWIFHPLSIHQSSLHLQRQTWLSLKLETRISEPPCCHPSASSSPFSFVFVSPATSSWSMLLLLVKDCHRLFKSLVYRFVKIGSCCRSKGTVKRVRVIWSKGSVLFGRSNSGPDKLLKSSHSQFRQSIIIR